MVSGVASLSAQQGPAASALELRLNSTLQAAWVAAPLGVTLPRLHFIVYNPRIR